MRRRAGFAALLLLAGVLSSAAMAQDGGARYLIIAADQFVGACRPLAEWKTAKGMLARVVPVSEAGGGTNPEAIRNYIRTAWSTWPVPPEYVLIAGSPDYIRAPSNYYDGRYGDLAGDYKMEIPVGRLPAANARECTLLVAKVLAYEKLAGSDTSWLARGATVVREDNDPEDDTIYWNDARTCHRYWQNAGYELVDSLSRLRGHTSASVNAAAADGRAFLAYRGQGVGSWYSPFNAVTPGTWGNGQRMPVVIGATCATVTLAPGETMYGDQFVRAGTVAGLGGAIAYFGTTRSGVGIARPRSNCFRGFFASFYANSNPRLGDATLEGRAWTLSTQDRYEEWNLMGDPELNVWTALPRSVEVVCDSTIAAVPQEYRVRVRAAGQPVAGAVVCAWMDSVVYATELTGADGEAVLDINPGHIGTMLVTVTGRNLRPWQGECAVTPGGAAWVIVADQVIDDFAGNRDGRLNPGERFRLEVALRNVGGAPASEVSAVLRSSEPPLTINDSTASWGTLRPEETGWASFELALDTTPEDGRLLDCRLEITDTEGDTWQRGIQLLVRAGRLEPAEVLLLDSPPGGNANGRLGAGESGRLRVRLRNAGGGRLDACRGRLAALDTNCLVLDSTAWYGWLNPGDTAEGLHDMFAVAAGPGVVPNGTVRFRLLLEADGGSYGYSADVEFDLPTEAVSGGPTGPDAYGYWCYDDTDSASGRAPVYAWQDIRTVGTWIDSVSTRDAATVHRPLPFDFRYYGRDYSEISICSNGFLALGRQSYTNGNNGPLPDTGGAAAMVSPFWDDLNPSEQGYGDAHLWHDTAGHRFIVQFTEFAHYGQPNIRETFQVVLLDPEFHPTPTADGDVLMMYERVQNNSSCTVGIEDHSETRGICYLYNNSYAPGASWLAAGRALRFTTFPPMSAERPWLVAERVRVTDSLGNNNGLFEAGETLAVTVRVRNRGPAGATGAAVTLRSLDPDATVLDSATALGDIPAGGEADGAEPMTFAVAVLPGDSLLNFELRFSADGYGSTGYFSVSLDAVTGLAGRSNAAPQAARFEQVRPQPARGRVTVQYSLGRAGDVELVLVDAAGRLVRTVDIGRKPAGRQRAAFATSGLSAGVYFCRLRVLDPAGGGTDTRRVQVVR
ncbi:MAG: C25 family cysteine peptidase [bacterium]